MSDSTASQAHQYSRQTIWHLFSSDINELSLPPTCRTEFPDPDDLLNFKLYISPDEVIHTAISVFGLPTQLS